MVYAGAVCGGADGGSRSRIGSDPEARTGGQSGRGTIQMRLRNLICSSHYAILRYYLATIVDSYVVLAALPAISMRAYAKVSPESWGLDMFGMKTFQQRAYRATTSSKGVLGKAELIAGQMDPPPRIKKPAATPLATTNPLA